MLVIFAARGCAGRSRVRNLRFLTPVTGPTRYSLAEDEQFQKDKRREAGYRREESADEVFCVHGGERNRQQNRGSIRRIRYIQAVTPRLSWAGF